MSCTQLHRHASELLVYGPVTDVSDDSLATGGTCTARLYDPSKDQTVTAAVTGTSWPVSRPGILAAGDSVRLELDDGTWHLTTITTVGASTIDVNAAPPSQASAGRVVYVKLGDTVSMTEVASTAKYQGTLGPAAQHLLGVSLVRVEYTLSMGGGLTGHEAYEATVV